MKTLFEGKSVRIFTFIVLALGVLCLVIALLLLGLSALGHLGFLADVGPAENRNMGNQLRSLGLPPLIVGLLLCMGVLLAFVWKRRRGAPKPDGAARK